MPYYFNCTSPNQISIGTYIAQKKDFSCFFFHVEQADQLIHGQNWKRNSILDNVLNLYVFINRNKDLHSTDVLVVYGRVTEVEAAEVAAASSMTVQSPGL